MKNEIIKGWDAVAFQRKRRAEIYEEIKDMTTEEEMAYFKKHSAWAKSDNKETKHHTIAEPKTNYDSKT